MADLMRVVLTGASGFIGRHLLERLVEAGHEVHAVSRGGVASQPQGPATWHRRDLLSPPDRNQLFADVRPQGLIHLAWTSEHGQYWTSPSNLDWVAASADLVCSFHKYGGQRVVVAGTCAEYDWDVTRGAVDESAPTRPSSLYGVAKDALRRLLAEYGATCGLSFAWGRVFSTFGPGEAPERLVPSVIRALLKGEEAKVSSGRQIRDFMDVRDAATAFQALLCSDVQGSVNVGTGTGTSIAEITRRIGDLLERSHLIRLGALPDRAGDPLRLVPSTERLNNEVGFSPSFSLDEGLENTVGWWEAARRDPPS